MKRTISTVPDHIIIDIFSFMHITRIVSEQNDIFQVRPIAVFPVFRLLTGFVCLLTDELCLSLWKIARCSAFIFFYIISNNNCRLFTINIVSFISFYYRVSKPPFCLHYEKGSLLNIVYRKINWQNPASISAYTQSENRISNYVNHIRIIDN